MPLTIKRADITDESVEIIVNAANSALQSGGGVNGAIHRVAGQQLREECKKLGGCQPGQAKATSGFGLHCKYIIHTVGPKWKGGGAGELDLLASCYRSSLALAKALNCTSIAFSIISSGAYGFPKEKALKIAIGEIGQFLLSDDMDIRIVVNNKGDFVVREELLDQVAKHIDACMVEINRCGTDTAVLTTRLLSEEKKAVHQRKDAPDMSGKKLPFVYKKRAIWWDASEKLVTQGV